MNKRIWCLFILFIFCVPAAGEQTATEPGDPVTTGDPNIPVDELNLRLRPLTQAEVKVEVDGWLKLLQQKVQEISAAEIAVSYMKAELAMAGEMQQALDAVDKAKRATSEQSADEETAAELKQAEQNIQELTSAAGELARKAAEDKAVARITGAAEKAIEQQEKAAAETDPGDADEGEPAADTSGEDENTEIADKEIAREKSRVQEAADATAASRNDLLNYLTGLREQQTALIDRTNAAIDDYERKGGKAEEVEEYRKYIGAVSAVEVDVSDASATWTMVSGWLISEEGGLRLLKNSSVFILIVLVAMFLSRLVSRALKKVMARSRQTSRLLGDFLVVTVRRLVIAIGILIGLAAMEINVGPLLAVIGAAGFVIAFALQNSLGNFASGILIMVFRPFDVGDLVEVGGVLGQVQSMNLLSILIHTPDNKSVIIPNNNVWSDAITNVTGTDTRRVDLVFGIAYDDDMEKAQKIMEQVVSDNAMVLKDPEPVIRVHELADSSVNFVCRPWVKTEDYWEAYWALTRAVKERFDKEGISIPFPQSDVHVIAAAGGQDAAALAGSGPATGQAKRSAREQTGDYPADDSETATDA
jgi:small conductance mechanosensitive channel